MLGLQTAFTSISEALISEHNKRSKDMVVGNDKCLLNPRGKVSGNWDLGIAALLIVTIFTMPLSMAFQEIEVSPVVCSLILRRTVRACSFLLILPPPCFFSRVLVSSSSSSRLTVLV